MGDGTRRASRPAHLAPDDGRRAGSAKYRGAGSRAIIQKITGSVSTFAVNKTSAASNIAGWDLADVEQRAGWVCLLVDDGMGRMHGPPRDWGDLARRTLEGGSYQTITAAEECPWSPFGSTWLVVPPPLAAVARAVPADRGRGSGDGTAFSDAWLRYFIDVFTPWHICLVEIS